MINILLPIHPDYTNNIINKIKTIEVRKTVPHNGMPFKVFMYETKHSFNSSSQTIMGSFTVRFVDGIKINKSGEYEITNDLLKSIGLSKDELNAYGQGKNLYLWYISDPVRIYPYRTLESFGIKYPPQSFIYLKEDNNE